MNNTMNAALDSELNAHLTAELPTEIAAKAGVEQVLLAQLADLQAENEMLRNERALYRAQLEDMVKRFESVIKMLRVISGSRVADLAEQQKPPETRDS